MGFWIFAVQLDLVFHYNGSANHEERVSRTLSAYKKFW